MNENLCLRLESLGALVRERLPAWQGYRGQGRRAAFLDRVLALALFLGKSQARRAGGIFPVARMALEPVLGLGDHAIRSALKCLVEIGVLEPASSLERKGKRVGLNPDARPVWFRARLYRLSEAARQILAPEPARPAENQTRQEKVSPVKDREGEGRGDSRRSLLLAPCRPVRTPDPAAVALLAALFKGSAAEAQAAFDAIPDAPRRRSPPERGLAAWRL